MLFLRFKSYIVLNYGKERSQLNYLLLVYLRRNTLGL